MSSKGEKHAKEETRTFPCTNAPTVGQDIKSMGARMCLQHAKGYTEQESKIFEKKCI